MSHRALLFAALARGESRLSGVLPGEDCRSTAGILRRLGAGVPRLPDNGSEFVVTSPGAGSLVSPGAPALDCGNSGTTARLFLGLLAGLGLEASLNGDRSLRARPMRRVTGPLEAAGAAFREEGQDDRLPIGVIRSVTRPIEHESPVASAQVKSALLLAGLGAGVSVAVTEPVRSRDHTERMLRRCGVPVDEHTVETPDGPDAWRVVLPAPPDGVPWTLDPFDLAVPADISSAVFPLALALLGGAPGAEERIGGERAVSLSEVGVNPTRAGILAVLERMGARVEWRAVRGESDPAGEPTADLVVRPGGLEAATVTGDELPSLIDEVPILTVLAVRARGRTVIRGAEELRVKESDRIDALVRNLRTLGVEVDEYPDGLAVTGTDRPLQGRVDPRHDHRIAMAFGVLGALPGNRIEVDDPDVVDVSYPGFWTALNRWTGRDASSPGPGVSPRPVVTIDGPAGSGKSSTARSVAHELGFRHLDSGALFRAVTLALLRSGRPESRWGDVSKGELDAMSIGLVPGDDGFDVRVADRIEDEALRSDEVTDRVAQVAQIPEVRRWLLQAQRRAAVDGGVVVDGRDTGTVIFPDADVKVFLVAGLQERARRRLLQNAGPELERPDREEVREEAARLAARDRNDETRRIAPLRRPDDAVEIDTTELEFDEQVDRIVQLVRDWTRNRP